MEASRKSIQVGFEILISVHQLCVFFSLDKRRGSLEKKAEFAHLFSEQRTQLGFPNSLKHIPGDLELSNSFGVTGTAVQELQELSPILRVFQTPISLWVVKGNLVPNHQ